MSGHYALSVGCPLSLNEATFVGPVSIREYWTRRVIRSKVPEIGKKEKEVGTEQKEKRRCYITEVS